MATTKIGHITEDAYLKLAREALELIETMTNCQFAIGDMALRVEPLRDRRDPPSGVYQSLQRFADDIGVEFATLLNWRKVAAAWPAEHRVKQVPYSVFTHLATMKPDEERFAAIHGEPPLDPRTGQRRWTYDNAARLVNHTPTNPVTPDERVNKIHDLARTDEVAATVVSDMLRRPEVADRVLSDPTSRHMIARAHVARIKHAQEVAKERTPVIRAIEHRKDVLEVTAACAAFVATMNRHMPGLHEGPLGDDQRHTILDGLDRVHRVEEWCRTVVGSGDISLDEQLTKFLGGD